MKTNKTYITSILFVVLGFFSNAFAQEQTKDSLSHYIKVAIENNPGVKSQRLVHEAFLQKIPQAGAYQDPELSLEAYTMPMEIIGGRSIGNISLMQMFPWFGTRKAARTEATHMANMQDQQYREAVDNLILQVSTQWYTMQKLNEQLHNNEENKKILDQLEQLALRKFSSPPSTARPTPVPTVSSNAPSTPSTSTASSGMGGMSMGKVQRRRQLLTPARICRPGGIWAEWQEVQGRVCQRYSASKWKLLKLKIILKAYILKSKLKKRNSTHY